MIFRYAHFMNSSGRQREGESQACGAGYADNLGLTLTLKG
jgi:hypothetical protein